MLGEWFEGGGRVVGLVGVSSGHMAAPGKTTERLLPPGSHVGCCVQPKLMRGHDSTLMDTRAKLVEDVLDHVGAIFRAIGEVGETMETLCALEPKAQTPPELGFETRQELGLLDECSSDG